MSSQEPGIVRLQESFWLRVVALSELDFCAIRRLHPLGRYREHSRVRCRPIIAEDLDDAPIALIV